MADMSDADTFVCACHGGDRLHSSNFQRIQFDSDHDFGENAVCNKCVSAYGGKDRQHAGRMGMQEKLPRNDDELTNMIVLYRADEQQKLPHVLE